METQNPSQNDKPASEPQQKYEGYTNFHPADAKKPAFELNLGQLFLGLILTFGGLFFLAKNMGWLEIKSLPFDWQRYWPILLVFAGLAMVKTKNFIATLIGVAVTILLFGFIAWIIFGLGFCSGI